MELEEIIRLRRNVKPQFFTGEEISNELVSQLLQVANWAPTHGYTEPWRFEVFSGESKMELALFQSNLYQTKCSQELFKKSKYDKLLKMPTLASHIIAVVVQKSQGTSIPFMEEVVATSCAVQNVLLSAAKNEIAVHWTSGGMTYEEEMKSFLGYKEHDQVLGFLYLGKCDEKINQEGRRISDIKNKTNWR